MPPSYFPETMPQARGDQVMAPTPGDRAQQGDDAAAPSSPRDLGSWSWGALCFGGAGEEPPTVIPILWKSSGSCTSTFSRWNMWYSACSQMGGIRLNCRATEYASCTRARTLSAPLLPPSPLPNPPAKP